MLSIISAVAMLALVQPAGSTKPDVGSPDAGAAAITLTPAKITETRKKELLPPPKSEDGGMTFKFNGMEASPGLRVTLNALLPKDQKIIEIEQPDAVKATDSAGTDISEIEEGFGGEREYLKIDQFGSPFDDDNARGPQEITLKLGSPKREAKSFSASFTCNVLTAGAPKAVELPVNKSWTKFDIPEFAGLDTRCRVKVSGDSTEIEFKNDAVKRRIQKVAIVNASGRAESSGWSSMNGLLSYQVDQALEASGKIELMVYSGAKRQLLKVELKDLALP